MRAVPQILALALAATHAAPAAARVALPRIERAYDEGDYPQVIELCRKAVREKREATDLPVIRDYLDDASYRLARIDGTRDGYRDYRTRFPRGRYVQDALERECELWFDDALADGTDAALIDWLTVCESTLLAIDAVAILDGRERSRQAGMDDDGDGLANAIDPCPQRAEVLNSWEDDDGCPDRLPTDLAHLLGVQEEVRFAVSSDELVGMSRNVLGRLAELLLRYPGVHVEVQGHASSEGDEDFNRELSRLRAAAVASVLVNAGVAEERIHPVGYGSTRPRASNTTDEGRALNRRVEIRPWLALPSSHAGVDAGAPVVRFVLAHGE